MINKLILSLLLVIATNVNAEQTFEQQTANKSEYFYDVEYQLEVIETNTPTDFYISELDVASNTWTKISNTFGWGNSNTISVEYIPDRLISNGKLGIHTGNRNSGTFSILPTDVTDVDINVIYASGTFNNIDTIWYDDIFYLTWDIDISTVPSRLELQYKLASGTWTGLGDVDVASKTIAVHNEFAMQDVKFRLAYDGINYAIAKTQNATFVNAELYVINKNEVELSTYKDGQKVQLLINSNRISEYTHIVVYKDGVEYGIIPYNQSVYEYTTSIGIDETILLEFYTEWGYKLNEVTIKSQYKWFEVGPIGSIYKVTDVIEFAWAYSTNFRYVYVYVQRNSSETFTKINTNWQLQTNYKYTVNPMDSTLKFKFVTDDVYTELNVETGLVTIIDECKEDSLYKVIDDMAIVIDSLKSVKPDTVNILVTLIKDIPLSVEIEDKNNIQDISVYSSISNGIITIDNPRTVSHLYIANYIGQVVYEVSGNSVQPTIDISGYNSGMYFMIIIEFDGTTSVYKFTM